MTVPRTGRSPTLQPPPMQQLWHGKVLTTPPPQTPHLPPPPALAAETPAHSQQSTSLPPVHNASGYEGRGMATPSPHQPHGTNVKTHPSCGWATLPPLAPVPQAQ